MTALLASLLLAASPPLVQLETYTLPNGLTVILAPDATAPDRRRRPLVPRGGGERDARAQRLRAPVRAPDVPGVEAPPRRTSRTYRAPRVGRQLRRQRQHRERPHELLRDAARQPARAGAVAGERADGASCSTASTRPSSTTSATWCATSGARASRTARTARPRSASSSCSYPPAPVPRRGHRLARGPPGRHARRREGVLPHLLRAGTTPRWSSPATSTRRRTKDAGREVLRPHPPLAAATGPGGPDAPHHPADPRDHDRRRAAVRVFWSGSSPRPLGATRRSPTTWSRRSSPAGRPPASTARWSSSAAWRRRWT